MSIIMLAEVAGNPAAPGQGAASVLALLLLYGLMGLVGQAARAAVGLKTMTNSAATSPGQQTEFNAAYLLISLMIGFVAGVLAGFAMSLPPVIVEGAINVKILLGIAAAGYAGTDFIENSLSIFIPNKPADSKSGAQLNDSSVSGLTSSVQVLGGHVANLVDMISTMPKPSVAPAAGAAPASAAPTDVIPQLKAAFKSCAPRVNADLWVPLLASAFGTYGLQTNKRMAAAIGQFLVEAGSGERQHGAGDLLVRLVRRAVGQHRAEHGGTRHGLARAVHGGRPDHRRVVRVESAQRGAPRSVRRAGAHLRGPASRLVIGVPAGGVGG